VTRLKATAGRPGWIFASSASGLIALIGIVPSAIFGCSDSGTSRITSRSVTRFCDTDRRSATPRRVSPAHVSAKLKRRHDGADPRAIEIAWRAQRRLNRRWHHLVDERRVQPNKATVALARELAAFCWEIALLD
jgi:transposase